MQCPVMHRYLYVCVCVSAPFTFVVGKNEGSRRNMLSAHLPRIYQSQKGNRVLNN